MNKKFRTYEDLKLEIDQRKALLQAQKEIVAEDLVYAGEKIEPVISALSQAGKMVTRDNTSIAANIATGKLIDVVVRDFLLARTGWVTRLTVPYLLKNFTSHLIAENKDAILEKLGEWVGLHGKNGKMNHESPQHA